MISPRFGEGFYDVDLQKKNQSLSEPHDLGTIFIIGNQLFPFIAIVL
jgi:hypothetical protein